MNDKIRLALQVTIFTCIVGLAISYITQLVPNFPKLNFLEAIGVYCLWTPIHNFLIRQNDEYDR
jgi:hypothetical protein